MNSEDRCPRCGEGRLRAWLELDEEQQEVVKRLPGAVEYNSSAREQRHRWCPRCWFESTENVAREA